MKINLASILITIAIVFLLSFGLVSLLLNDYVSLVIPGWHTTIYPFRTKAIIVVAVTIVSGTVYILVRKFLNKILVNK